MHWRLHCLPYFRNTWSMHRYRLCQVGIQNAFVTDHLMMIIMMAVSINTGCILLHDVVRDPIAGAS